MFKKMVVIEPVNFGAAWMEKISALTKELSCFSDVPGSNAEIIRRIGDADGVLLSCTPLYGALAKKLLGRAILSDSADTQ